MNRTNRRDVLRSSALLGGALFAGCLGSAIPGGRDDPPIADGGTVLAANVARETPTVSEADLRAAVQGNTNFGFDLLDTLVAESPTDNLLLSPYSIGIALAMTWAGARSETEQAMADSLAFTLGQEGQHPAFNALDAELESRGDDGGAESNGDGNGDAGDPFRLATANAVWGQEGFPFRDSYLETLARNYGAGLRVLDFGEPEAARGTINDWVAAQTEEKIPELLPKGSITPAVRLVLTNAVYFLAAWAAAFDEGVTDDGSFTALDGSQASVPMMRQTEEFPYAEVDGHQVLELPYVGEEVGMVVVLPREGEFESFEQSIDADRFAALVSALEPQHGSVALPRFSYRSGFSLKDALTALGMGIAFEGGRADFSGMADGDAGKGLFIDEVYHKTFIAVDEDGTEAAAATGVVMKETAATMPTFEFVADRPFLYAIRDRATGALLFLGRVADAGAAQ